MYRPIIALALICSLAYAAAPPGTVPGSNAVQIRGKNVETPTSAMNGKVLGLYSSATGLSYKHIPAGGVSAATFNSYTGMGGGRATVAAVGRQFATKQNGVTLLGDSLTYGANTPSTAWGPSVFVNISSQHPAGNWTIINKGISGNNTVDVLARLKTDVLDPETKIVVLQIGTNDASTWHSVPISAFEANMRSIISQILTRGKKIILMIPPAIDEGYVDWDPTPLYTNALLAPYQQKIRDLANELHIDMVDNSSIPQITTNYVTGGVHLSSTGYALIYNNLMPVLLHMMAYPTGEKTGIGTLTPQVPLHVHMPTSTGVITATGTALYNGVLTGATLSAQDNSAPFDFVVADGTATAGLRGGVRGVRSRGTLVSPTVPVTDDYVFTVNGGIWDGGAVINTAEIALKVDGAVTSRVAPQRVIISTKTGGSGAYVERLTIKNNGMVGINSITPSYQFEVGGDIAIKAGSGGVYRFSDTTMQTTAFAVNKLFGMPLDISGIATNDYLKWNGTSWVNFPATAATAAGTVTGAIQVKSSTTVVAADDTVIVDATNHRLGIGTVTPGTPVDIYNTTAGGSIIRARDEATSAVGGGLFAALHNNASNALPAPGDALGIFAGGYLDGATVRYGSLLVPYAETGIVTGASGRYGGWIVKTANGGGPAERLRITSTGDHQINGHISYASNSSCTASVTPYGCCTGSGTGTCQAVPVLTACGTSPTVVGNNSIGKIVIGATGIACTITFAASPAFTSAPACIVTGTAAVMASSTTTVLTITAVPGTYMYHCNDY